MAATEAGGKVYFDDVTAYHDGDVGWGFGAGELRFPGVAPIPWHAHFVFRNEGGTWRWVMCNAGPPGTFEIPEGAA
jgi:hypothetical protein